MSGLFGKDTIPNVATRTFPNNTENGESPASKATIFDEAVAARQAKEGGNDAEGGNDQEEKPTEAMVTMPDGTQITAAEYIAKENADQRVEWARKEAELAEREKWLPTAESQQQQDQQEQEEDTGPELVQWQPLGVENRDQLDDNEAALYDQMNTMGQQFTGIINKLQEENHNLNTKLADTERTTRDIQLDRHYARAEAQYGVTPDEIREIHKEYPNSFDIDLLAQTAAARKQDNETQEDAESETREKRNDALSKVGGASNDRGASREDADQDRAKKVTDWSDGAQIAQHYKGLL